MGIKSQNKLTSGPFFVPLAVDFLLIGFKNLANKTSTVNVSVHACRDITPFPATPPEIEIFREEVTIPAGNCAVIKFDAGPTTFRGNNMLRETLDLNARLLPDGSGHLLLFLTLSVSYVQYLFSRKSINNKLGFLSLFHL